MPLLVDTGVLYALADRRDAWHTRVRNYLQSHRETLLAPVTVLPEVTYLLRERISAEAEHRFVTSLARNEVAVEPVRPIDLQRADELLADYSQIGFVDATVVAIAERLQLEIVATTDHRHFASIRPSHIPHFTLVP